MCAEILDLETAIDRQVYIFLNPAQANLVDSIDDYPGETTWAAFLKTKAQVDAYHEREVPWIRLATVPELSSPCPSKNNEEFLPLGDQNFAAKFNKRQNPNSVFR